jgi:hypothetical protein
MKTTRMFFLAMMGLFIVLILQQGCKKKETYKPFSAVSLDAMRILYEDFPNPITIAVPGYQPEQVRVKLDTGQIDSTGIGRYNVIVPRLGKDRDTVKLYISVIKDKAEIGIDTFIYRVIKMPKPVPYFGKRCGSDSILPSEISKVDSIRVELPGFLLEGVGQYFVKKFKFVAVPKKGNAFFAENNCAALTPAMKNALNTLKNKGDMIIVTDVYSSFITPKNEVVGSSPRSPAGIILKVSEK